LYFLFCNKWKINAVLVAIFMVALIVPFQSLMIPLVNIYGRRNY